MEPKKLLSADYLDILFDNRNKKYGGYELRKNYNRRIKKALILIVTIVSSVITFSFVSAHTHPKPFIITYKKPFVLTNIVKRIAISQPKCAMLPVAQPSHPHADPGITAHLHITPDPLVTPADIPIHIAQAPAGKTADSISGPGELNDGTAGNGDGPAPDGVPVVLPKNDAPIRIAQVMPSFPGDLNEYLSKNLQYPDEARENGKEGTVIISFVINEDGTVSDAAISRSVDASCDQEALRIIKAMPKWKPGKQNGMPVKVWFALPIRFELR